MKQNKIELKFRSDIHRFDPTETYQERHNRRYRIAMSMVHIIREWCEYRKIEMVVAESEPIGWKWDFKVPDKFAQWRPFAGKLHLKVGLRSKNFYSFKVHDVLTLIEVLERWYEATGDVW